MRFIQFRGKCLAGKRWLLGSLEVPLANPVVSKYYILGYSYGQYGRHEVQKDTVGQFVGLIDCTGAKIFEGDIVQTNPYEAEPIYKVVRFFTSDSFVGIHPFTPGLPNAPADTCMVVGNIHDNPDLIEELQ